jgi:hypothetical protein
VVALIVIQNSLPHRRLLWYADDGVGWWLDDGDIQFIIIFFVMMAFGSSGVMGHWDGMRESRPTEAEFTEAKSMPVQITRNSMIRCSASFGKIDIRRENLFEREYISFTQCGLKIIIHLLDSRKRRPCRFL